MKLLILLGALLLSSCTDIFNWGDAAEKEVPEITKTLLVEISAKDVSKAEERGDLFLDVDVTVPLINAGSWRLKDFKDAGADTERRTLQVPVFRLGYDLGLKDASGDISDFCWAYDFGLKSKAVTNEREAPWEWCENGIIEYAPSFATSLVSVRNWLWNLF